MIAIEGIDNILLELKNIVDMSNIEQAVGKGCAVVEREAKKKAPKRSGDLRRSIKSKVESSGTDVIGTVFSPLEYAPYVEYGTGLFAESGGRTDVPWAYKDEKTGELIWTSGQHPKPFLRPALNENREKVKEIIKGGIAK